MIGLPFILWLIFTTFDFGNIDQFFAILGVTGIILNFPCLEFSGEMTLQDGEVFKASCLVSKKHSSTTIMDYNFLNIQPIIVGYKIVLAWRTTSTSNENTMIKAYKIEPGNTDSYFDLSQYQQK